MENLSEKKQIEEMARVIRPLTLCPNCLASLNRDKKRDGGCYRPIGYECSLDRDILKYCEALYNAGYRKQSENTIELPCKVGDKVYRTSRNCCEEKIFEGVVNQINIYKNGEIRFWMYGHPLGFACDDIGKTVFLTKEEAEAKNGRRC